MTNILKEAFIYSKKINWKRIILILIISFYSVLYFTWFGNGNIIKDYGGDYLAFWSAGKIANEKGYSEIYTLDNLRSVQTQELTNRSVYEYSDNPIFTIPAPYLSFFILPFQFLSKMELELSFWVWTFLNLAILIGYTFFILRTYLPGKRFTRLRLTFFVLELFSFPIFSNIINGQINVLMLICIGEFIHSAAKKRAFISGLWLGGLLLKPQLLILVIPILIFNKYWKVFFGFMVSSGTIFLFSFILSGIEGLKALISLLTKYSVGISTNNPQFMINWRMVGLNLNTLTNSSIGWIAAGLGIILSILTAYILIKRRPTLGSPSWVMNMMGVFFITISVSWHSHYHMAAVLIPFIIYVYTYNFLPKNILLLWFFLTPVVWIGVAVVNSLSHLITNYHINIDQGIAIAVSGLIANLVIIIAIIKNSHFYHVNYVCPEVS